MNKENAALDMMQDIQNGIRHMRDHKPRPIVNDMPRGWSRTALKRKIVTLRQMLMDIHDEL